MSRKLNNLENEKNTLYELEYGKKTEKRGARDTNTVRPGIWLETLKNL
jgi:hypothetical protein